MTAVRKLAPEVPGFEDRHPTGFVAVARLAGIIRPNNVDGGPWHAAGSFGWRLEDVFALPNPVSARGLQRLWNVPADLEARILAQLPRRYHGSDLGDGDTRRLNRQHDRVREAALNWPGGWFTMYELARKLNAPEASVERQVRYLKEERFGGYAVEKRRVEGANHFEFRVQGKGTQLTF